MDELSATLTFQTCAEELTRALTRLVSVTAGTLLAKRNMPQEEDEPLRFVLESVAQLLKVMDPQDAAQIIRHSLFLPAFLASYNFVTRLVDFSH